MRVLHICAGNLYGGVETIQVTLARHRHECSQMEPHYAVCFHGRLNAELTASGVPVHEIGALQSRNPVSVLRARARLRELLWTFQFDAAICHSAWTQTIFGSVVKLAGIPLIHWLHGTPEGTHWLERCARRVRPQRVICCSEFTSKLLWKLYPGVPGEVVYPPVHTDWNKSRDISQRGAIRKELSTPDDAVVIIQVSRMEALKGHRLHLEALAALKDVSDWVCWMVGGAQRKTEAQYAFELENLAKQLKISDRVRFIGERSDVQRLLHAADLFCQPNIGADAFGITFVEALGAGLPVVTAAIGGGQEVVNSNCGVLVPPRDALSLSVALEQAIGNASLRQRWSEAAPARAKELCEPRQQLNRLVGVIQHAIERSAA
jgi:glycosyltransferase involved in cell wall biosynthesis